MTVPSDDPRPAEPPADGPPLAGDPAWSPPPQQAGGLSAPGGGDNDDRLWATLAHAGSIVAALVAMAFLAPLVVLLVKGEQSPFVRRHAVESLNFQITTLIALAAGVVASLGTLGLALVLVIPLGIAYGVFWLVCIVLASARANEGKEYQYPLTLRLVK